MLASPQQVVAFPFPRYGLWAIGFVMGTAPSVLQVSPTTNLLMVFVPTALHPFSGLLAFVPQAQLRPINLAPEEAIKMECTAGLYKPESGWLNPENNNLATCQSSTNGTSDSPSHKMREDDVLQRSHGS